MSRTLAPFVARPSPLKLLLILAGAIALFSAGAALAGFFGPLEKPGFEWFGWFAMALFGACAAVLLLRLFDRRDQIVVDSQGISWAQWSDALIPWNAITEVFEGRTYGQRFVCLRLAHPERFPSTKLLGRFAAASKAMGYGDIALNAVGTDKSFESLRDAVFHWWDDNAKE